ncbi:MAG: hypothetical protein PHE86_07075 [Candidatus Marinimicrobia bacterium]|nr:hypothetical protein [Candidatus Neomarinimicrobiota bacterium]MDD5582695.1 hypothetical protein [Candidatus Neomarinimicrobiota bacterium]
MDNLLIDDFYRTLRKGEIHLLPIYAVRDLTKIDLHDGYALIVAVDSDGGIGPRPGDTVFCDPYELGRFAIRVPLLEVLASGAIPLAAYNMLTLPMDDVGKEILRGIREEIEATGLGENFHVSGSTEDNVPTTMTGVGTCVLGLVHQKDFRPGTSQSKDVVVCIGLPKSAPKDTVHVNDPEILALKDLLTIQSLRGIHDILPVGSHGAGFEMEQMARSAKLYAKPIKSSIDLKKSGGPSTCVIASMTEETFNNLNEIIHSPITKIGLLWT